MVNLQVAYGYSLPEYIWVTIANLGPGKGSSETFSNLYMSSHSDNVFGHQII